MLQRHRWVRNLMLPALLIVAGAPHGAEARTTPPGSEEREIARCIRAAAGGRSWLEKTLWGLRDQEGGWIGAAVLNTNGSHDLGPLQVNTWWVPRIASLLGSPAKHVRHWLRTDPCFNAEVARWIFLSALARSGDYWEAVGIYHSPTDWRQRRYAANVASKLRRRFGAAVFDAGPPGMPTPATSEHPPRTSGSARAMEQAALSHPAR